MPNPHPLPFKTTGAAANPNGRPKAEWTMSGLIREAAEEMDETGVPKKVIIARKLTAMAAKGDIVALKELNNRLDGMPSQKIEATGNLTIQLMGGGYAIPESGEVTTTPTNNPEGSA
jgi:hypothetical protein